MRNTWKWHIWTIPSFTESQNHPFILATGLDHHHLTPIHPYFSHFNNDTFSYWILYSLDVTKKLSPSTNRFHKNHNKGNEDKSTRRAFVKLSKDHNTLSHYSFIFEVWLTRVFLHPHKSPLWWYKQWNNIQNHWGQQSFPLPPFSLFKSLIPTPRAVKHKEQHSIKWLCSNIRWSAFYWVSFE